MKCVEVRQKTACWSSLLLLCGSQEWNSDCLAWWLQEPLPTEPSLWPSLLGISKTNRNNDNHFGASYLHECHLFPVLGLFVRQISVCVAQVDPEPAMIFQVLGYR